MMNNTSLLRITATAGT